MIRSTPYLCCPCGRGRKRPIYELYNTYRRITTKILVKITFMPDCQIAGSFFVDFDMGIYGKHRICVIPLSRKKRLLSKGAEKTRPPGQRGNPPPRRRTRRLPKPGPPVSRTGPKGTREFFHGIRSFRVGFCRTPLYVKFHNPRRGFPFLKFP